jgi:hypothetical protein
MTVQLYEGFLDIFLLTDNGMRWMFSQPGYSVVFYHLVCDTITLFVAPTQGGRLLSAWILLLCLNERFLSALLKDRRDNVSFL